MPGFHIKNLFLRDRKKRIFLITQEDCSIDLKKTEKLMGCDIGCLLGVRKDFLRFLGCAQVR